MRVYNRRYKGLRSRLWLIERREDYEVRAGAVDSAHGVVSVDAARNDKARPEFKWVINFSIMFGGYRYCRDITGLPWTERGLITRARRFAAEMARQHADHPPP